MSDFPQTCTRCTGSGEIGRKCRGAREAPGPVPDDEPQEPNPLTAKDERAAHLAAVEIGVIAREMRS